MRAPLTSWTKLLGSLGLKEDNSQYRKKRRSRNVRLRGLEALESRIVFSVDLTVGNSTLDETNNTQTFAVLLSEPSTDTVTVDFATGDGTALDGSDYTATSGVLTFTPGYDANDYRFGQRRYGEGIR